MFEFQPFLKRLKKTAFVVRRGREGWMRLIQVDTINIGGEAPGEQIIIIFFKNKSYTLPETNIAPKNGWLEDDPFPLGWPIFRGYVSFRECNS